MSNLKISVVMRDHGLADRLKKPLTPVIKSKLSKVVNPIVRLAKAYTTVRSGRLQRSFEGRVEATVRTVRIVLRSDARYAIFVVRGTVQMRAVRMIQRAFESQREYQMRELQRINAYIERGEAA